MIASKYKKGAHVSGGNSSTHGRKSIFIEANFADISDVLPRYRLSSLLHNKDALID